MDNINIIFDTLVQRICTTDAYLLPVTDDLTDEQLSKRPSQTAPPIGWHLWHIARWADRFQASFPKRGDSHLDQPSDPNRDIGHNRGFAWLVRHERNGDRMRDAAAQMTGFTNFLTERMCAVC